MITKFDGIVKSLISVTLHPFVIDKDKTVIDKDKTPIPNFDFLQV